MNASSIKYSLSLADLPLALKGVIGLLLFGIFTIFRIAGYSDAQRTSHSIEGVLRSEYRAANSYALSKAIADLESIGVFKCVKLVERSNGNRVFYDTSTDSNCASGKFKSFKVNQSEFTAVNGLEYGLEFQRSLPWSVMILEILSYAAVLAFSALYAHHWRDQRSQSEIKMRLLDLERELAVDSAKQVKHDVASPLGTLKIIAQALKNVDPEVKDLLVKAVSRTEDIFGQLTQQGASERFNLEAISLRESLAEIVEEKKLLWGGTLQVQLRLGNDDKFYGESVEFKRIISNLLNNSYESLTEEGPREIMISSQSDGSGTNLRIKDSGRGMSPEILAKLGQKGFSYGKDGIQGAGSGLGVHHASITIKRWGGKISFQSKPGIGTEIHILLKGAN